MMEYKVLLNQLVNLEEMDPMWTIEWKGIKENLDIKDLLDQEIEVWSLLDGDEPPVLQPMIRNYSTKGKLLGVITCTMEEEPTTFSTWWAFLNISPTSMEQDTRLTEKTRVL